MAGEQCFLRIGDDCPDFVAETQNGSIQWHEFIKGSWAVLCSHPKDFTPVCTTELGVLAQMSGKFAERNCKIAVVSVDTAESHRNWLKDVDEISNTKVEYPVIADDTRTVSRLFGMLDQTNLEKPGLPLTVRSVFVISPAKKIELIITYPASCGRNFDEILRVLDSLQLTAYQKVATPANWTAGSKCVVVPSIKTDDAKDIFPKGVDEVRPYLRFTPDPR
mmetsp:Transcript_32942/g.92254  ORF Transcript_32942/g.92254 Transcript_32942/m.92254 type:complete len:220 (+) Transcript_32942:167-826(+)|eukprot:CAMPEP_0119121222 /NCGR_PEP_ID=MMETSP1310-20130426/1960_1 /TAXON_ID=464262 /ORGANISM="Genus nov. species nov., Strain RCC2339" /LENGTH=219 /DNA_ID=CAMNT_0007110781 /DNA_START=81 /DNA_END=740 /DNA_ORIENTATION=+